MLPTVSFFHVHLYVDYLDELDVYKKLEGELDELSRQRQHLDLDAGAALNQKNEQKAKDIWTSIVGKTSSNGLSGNEADPKEFASQNRDVVRQMLVAFGFRVTGARYSNLENSTVTTNTRSVLLTSRDPNGIQILVTAIDHNAAPTTRDPFHHFDAAQVATFYKEHNNRQGVAVLAFLVDNVETIHERYMERQPKLVSHYEEYSDTASVRILEVYAFYRQHSQPENGCEADKGTVLRFMEMPVQQKHRYLPGIVKMDASFPDSSFPAYCDHWVSNVVHRTEFLDILNETLGFDIKVDFNAGVVAAGEAQIESTVAGNKSSLFTTDPVVALKDQSQVYLPINNALSEVGHVHLFLNEIGQGVQHVASRVEDLVSFVQQVNDQRRITGEGFTFLNIPRSYYGVLDAADMQKIVSRECATQIWNALDHNNLVAHDGAVDLDLSQNGLSSVLNDFLGDSGWHDECMQHKDEILQIIMQSRYKNLYSLLRSSITEEKYLSIVRNQILVDIQGKDLLYQIFTCKILHRKASDEAPFFEFIERVCAKSPDGNGCQPLIRPGCGGFGIRNFLTLFLSIEVSKALHGVSNARAQGDKTKQEYEQTRVDYFTAQLNESNPILTEISDAMQDEGILRQRLATALTSSEKTRLQSQIEDAQKRKTEGSDKLMKVSAKYNDLMKELRLRR